MREILFKAKRIDNGEWVEGYLFETQENSYIAYNGQFDDDLFLSSQNIFIPIDKTTICQYTGLKDKNGNRVFENDIVKLKFRDGRIGSTEREYNHVVRYDDFEASWEFEERKDLDLLGHPMLTQYNQHIYEVIGNIFDNPELLKGSEEE